MIDSASLQKLVGLYPALQNAGDDLKEQLLNYGIHKIIPTGEFIFLEEDSCSFFALVISGQVRVYKESETSREVTLYRFGKGESCILTVSCILGETPYPAIAVAEEDVEAVLIPNQVFREWTTRYEVWRRYIFDTLTKRFASVIMVVEEIAFHRMDSRIAEFILKSYVKSGHPVELTHQQIAAELGTSREVVSRILKDFEHENLIGISRAHIEILNPQSLEKKIKYTS